MSKGGIFKSKWELECGLKVTSRNASTGNVENVICLFCRAFGRETPDDNDNRKRKRSLNIQGFTPPWRIDKFKKHIKSMHPKKWAEYVECSASEKKLFFESALKANTTLSYFEETSIERREVIVEKEIIDTIIENLLYCSNDDEDVEIESARKKDFIGFELVSDDDDQVEYYRATIPNTLQYDLLIKTIGNGLSFSQTMNVLQGFKEMTGMGKIGYVSRRKITLQVRIYCAESFQTIAEAMRCCWTFSIALDGGNKSSVSYLDFRIRFALGFELFNLHLIAVPMYESHSGDNMFSLTEQILNVLCPNWREKIIGVTTDGASNMTGCNVGVVTQIQKVSKRGFYRVWCAAHQLDIVVQKQFKSMFNEKFVHVIQGITGHLRRQKKLIQKMKATCPRFINSRWLSMGRLLNWLISKRRDVQQHFQEKDPPCRPPNEWWIEVYALDMIVKQINITFSALQGKQLLLDQQREYLGKLREQLMRIGNVTTGGIMLTETPGVYHVGSFRMTASHAEAYLMNLASMYVIQLINEYKQIHEEAYNKLLERIAYLFLNLIQGIYVLSPERSAGNGAITVTSPPSMPFALAESGAFNFSNILMEQMDRLQSTFTEYEIDSIEEQFSNFLTKYHNDPNFKRLVENTSDCKTFAEAWSWLYKEYPLLVTFVGGLATTFPGTSTVESDFSVIGWEKDEYRCSLSDLSLEGILHAKQKQEIKHVQVVLNNLKQ